MTVANRGDPEDDTPCPVSAIYEGGVQCCSKDHQQEDHISDEVESHCGGGCCADDEEDCESGVDNCKDSCCGHGEDRGAAEEPAHKKDRQGEDGVLGGVESHCGGGCCTDDDVDYESNVGNPKNSCCGHREERGVAEEVACEDPRGTDRISSCIQGGF